MSMKVYGRSLRLVNRGTNLGVPVIRNIICGGLFGVPLFWETTISLWVLLTRGILLGQPVLPSAEAKGQHEAGPQLGILRGFRVYHYLGKEPAPRRRP